MIKFTPISGIADQDLILAQTIRDNCKTRNDVAVLENIEAEEGASLEYFEFSSLLSIYKALLTGTKEFAI